MFKRRTKKEEKPKEEIMFKVRVVYHPTSESSIYDPTHQAPVEYKEVPLSQMHVYTDRLYTTEYNDFKISVKYYNEEMCWEITVDEIKWGCKTSLIKLFGSSDSKGYMGWKEAAAFVNEMIIKRWGNQ